MNKKIKFRFFLILGLLASNVFFIYRSCDDKREFSKELRSSKKTIRLASQEIKKQNKAYKALEQANKRLNDKLYADSIKYRKERLKRIPERKTLVHESNILDQGVKMYGKHSLESSKRALIASYGSQAVDEVQTLRRKTANQKAQSTVLQDIILFKDTIIYSKNQAIKVASKKRRKNSAKWFGIGTVFGALSVIILL